MFVQLLPDAIGMAVTPLAIVGAILLLESKQPVPNAVAFGAAFGLLYTLVSVAVLLGGAAAGDSGPQGNSTVAAITGLVIGVAFIVGGVVTWIRKPVQRRIAGRIATSEPRWIERLESARPRTAFLTGLGVAVLNPNVLILLSGLAVVVAADTSAGVRVAGAGMLVGGSLIDFAVPIAIYFALGAARRERVLGGLRRWLVAHTRVITITMLLVLGVIFTWRGMSKL